MASAMTSKRMEPLQMVADRRKDAAGRALFDAQRALDESRTRLAELQRYRADYECNASASVSPQLLRNRQAFLDRLRAAEHFQEELVEKAQLNVDVKRAEWLTKNRGARTIAQLTATYVHREQREAERREQSRSDELSTQRYLRQRENPT